MPDSPRSDPTPVVTGGKTDDPSPRSLETIYREVRQMEEKLLGKFEAVEVRFKGYENAVKLLQEFANRQPTTEAVNGDVKALKELVASNLSGLKELIEAKFEGNKTALDAALKTQKEGSDKIESNFVKQFENIVTNIQTLTKSFDDKIGDVKDRFNTSQGRGTGRGDAWGILLGVASLAVAAAVVVGFIIART